MSNLSGHTVLVFISGLLILSSAHADNNSKSISEFSGVWEYLGKTELYGKIYVVQFRYSLFQNQDRICGYIDHAGAPNRVIERYSFMGVAHKNYADLWLDAGTPKDADYSPHYPIQPDSIERIKIVNGKLLKGDIISGKNEPLVFPENESYIIYLNSMPLRKKSKRVNFDDIYNLEPVETRAYIAACLNDPVERMR